MRGERFFVSGSRGFVGKHFVSRARQSGYGVTELAGRLTRTETDVVADQIAECNANVVIHLAARSSVRESLVDSLGYIADNVESTICMLDALKKTRFSGRLLYVSSSEVYDTQPAPEARISELSPLGPSNAYGISKVACELLCKQYAAQQGFELVIARPFAHIGFGQSDRFFFSTLVSQVRRIKESGVNTLTLGEIDVIRDISSVDDVIDAYLILLRSTTEQGIYNVCSGVGISLRDLVGMVCEEFQVRPLIQVDPQRVRPGDPRRIVGDNTKLVALSKWRPQGLSHVLKSACVL